MSREPRWSSLAHMSSAEVGKVMANEQTIATEGRRFGPRLIAVAAAVVAIVLFVVRHTDPVTVKFLFFEFRFPLFLLLLITMALTVILGLGVTWFMRRRGSA